MGRYVPPDLEGTKVSGNALHRRRPPGQSSTPGHQTVRFEMPFAVWCDSCPRPTIIGQGVRFNADKSRDGSYYSTPIWRFRMRHADCGGDIVMRTDPQNTAYVVVSGGRKRDVGEGDADARGAPGSGGAILTDDEREELRRNAFAKLERTIDDREQLRAASARIDELAEASARHWDDPYAQNQRLRRDFRQGRRDRERDAAYADDLRDRIGLGVDLLPASEDDSRRAAVVDFAPAASDYDDHNHHGAMAKPLFGDKAVDRRRATGSAGRGAGTKAERRLAASRDELVSRVIGNTRVARDPFLGAGVRGGSEARGTPKIPGVKRKRQGGDGPETPPAKSNVKASTGGGLVDYDSD